MELVATAAISVSTTSIASAAVAVAVVAAGVGLEHAANLVGHRHGRVGFVGHVGLEHGLVERVGLEPAANLEGGGAYRWGPRSRLQVGYLTGYSLLILLRLLHRLTCHKPSRFTGLRFCIYRT